MLWEVDVHPKKREDDHAAKRLAEDASAARAPDAKVAAARGFLLQSDGLDQASVTKIADQLLVDSVVEHSVATPLDDPRLTESPALGAAQLFQVLYKQGVMDPVAQSTERAIKDLGLPSARVRTLRKYWVEASEPWGPELAHRLLANDAIEQIVEGPLSLSDLSAARPYEFELKRVAIRGLDDEGLARLSKEGQLYLQLEEMRTIRKYYESLGREPTDIELESLAQTWSEHCSHKTLAGRISYRDENGERFFENMLKETIFAATVKLRERWGKDDWCESVFSDNAGVVTFDEQHNVCFKVETHNHPSAIEPYGGANTGLGGVLRDTLGTGLGAKPVCSTDVFCFAPPETPDESLPSGVLPPRRVMRGVVEGVRDYGNRMGVPTVNGAICFDERYLGNPLVFCGNVGLIPRDKTHKQPQENDLIVALGGRTGRDGIHGATFSSAELTSESETLSGGAVQIGNAIEQKKLADVLLQARDLGLYTAVTDCGAGGFSSAVGEMGEEIGAEVWLEKAPLKYEGLSYTEIWISEAQERMVLSVAESNWDALEKLCESEDVEATVIGRYKPGGELRLLYHGQPVGQLPMEFLHDGRPPVIREAVYTPPETAPLSLPERQDFTDTLLAILGSPNVASKEWVIRQYDHEVQGGSVVKPLVGVGEGGPSDAAVVRPKLDSNRGLVIACGINPGFGDLDPYRMAASVIDESIRNCVAVGADPGKISLLDNFCWGDCEKSETLGALVRAAIACHDMALAYDAPFISGKDSLNNEFSYVDDEGRRRTIAIPSTLLISAMGQIEDSSRAVTMDLKQAGSSLYVLGATRAEFGGSHFSMVEGLAGGAPPGVDTPTAVELYKRLHLAMQNGLVASCHDASEGGLAAAIAEMAFAGGLGIEARLGEVPATGDFASDHERDVALLFGESNSRLVCEVTAEKAAGFEQAMSGSAFAAVGAVNETDRVVISTDSGARVDADLAALESAWRGTFRGY